MSVGLYTRTYSSSMSYRTCDKLSFFQVRRSIIIYTGPLIQDDCCIINACHDNNVSDFPLCFNVYSEMLSPERWSNCSNCAAGRHQDAFTVHCGSVCCMQLHRELPSVVCDLLCVHKQRFVWNKCKLKSEY